MISRSLSTKIVLIGALMMCVFALHTLVASAEDVDDLKDKIDDKRDQIADIEAEIAKYEKELQKVGGERKTLENAIAELNLTRQKLLSDISLTQKKIQATQYSIENLGKEIQTKEQRIAQDNELLASALRTIHESDGQSLVETVLGYEDLSDFWVELDQLEQIRATVREELFTLRDLKEELVDKRTNEQKEHENLSAYKNKLSG